MEPLNPLEQFVLEYLDVVGGAWEQLEPQVYEVILPEAVQQRLQMAAPGGVARLTFDPEALADYPDAHLMMFGNPSLDRVFEHAQSQGQVAKLYVTGSNLSPHNLLSLLRRAVALPEKTVISVTQSRMQHFHSVVFFFQATLTSDEKQQEILSVGVERFYGRLVRHLQDNLRHMAISEAPPVPYADAVRIPLEQAYATGRQEALGAATILAHSRLADLRAGMHRQTERVIRYFADLRQELRVRGARAKARGEGAERFEGQLQALEREEQARLAELRQKMILRVHLQLLGLLQVVQPKLRLELQVQRTKGPATHIEVIWDSVTQGFEAIACPACSAPTFALAPDRLDRLVCSACVTSPAPAAHRRA